MSRWFPSWRFCHKFETHDEHKWQVTRMGETAYFKCPGFEKTEKIKETK